jgi:hypothetical protein
MGFVEFVVFVGVVGFVGFLKQACLQKQNRGEGRFASDGAAIVDGCKGL